MNTTKPFDPEIHTFNPNNPNAFQYVYSSDRQDWTEEQQAAFSEGTRLHNDWCRQERIRQQRQPMRPGDVDKSALAKWNAAANALTHAGFKVLYQSDRSGAGLYECHPHWTTHLSVYDAQGREVGTVARWGSGFRFAMKGYECRAERYTSRRSDSKHLKNVESVVAFFRKYGIAANPLDEAVEKRRHEYDEAHRAAEASYRHMAKAERGGDIQWVLQYDKDPQSVLSMLDECRIKLNEAQAEYKVAEHMREVAEKALDKAEQERDEWLAKQRNADKSGGAS